MDIYSTNDNIEDFISLAGAVAPFYTFLLASLTYKETKWSNPVVIETGVLEFGVSTIVVLSFTQKCCLHLC